VTMMAAVDIGAQSGRVVVGRLDGGRLAIEEVHRFPNVPVTAAGRLHWDVLDLYAQVLDGVAAAGRVAGELDSVGIDTWGVDFGLLDGDGTLLGNPVHHRDRRTEGVMERVFARVPARELYERTGIQLLPINTIFQLAAVAEGGGRALAAAERLLLVPDLLHYWLSGVALCERTNASTTQCLDARTGAWATDVLERLAIPPAPFRELAEPCTVLGRLRDDVAERTGLRDTRVAVPGTHDTASAVAAVPFRDPRAAYISAGTWSLVGVELAEPLISDDAFAANLTNEAGVGGTTRLLRNVDGLWLLHECRNAWAAEGRAWTFEELSSAAEAAPPLRSFIEPNDPRFLAPGDLPGRIRAFCTETGQPEPGSVGEVTRCILESLALKHAQTVRLLGAVTGSRAPEIHIVGGGALNRPLCRWTAEAAGLPVLVGPVEATAVGNLVAQAIALGELGSLEEAREVVRASFAPTAYEPSPSSAWLEAAERFEGLSEQNGQREEVWA
jgi:rhamnulokinase